MARRGWLYWLALLIVLFTLVCLVVGWTLCLLGSSDDGLHCAPAVLATAVAGPLFILGAVGAWVMRRRYARSRPAPPVGR